MFAYLTPLVHLSLATTGPATPTSLLSFAPNVIVALIGLCGTVYAARLSSGARGAATQLDQLKKENAALHEHLDESEERVRWLLDQLAGSKKAP
jgi:septal ring factor EnvC (AmiA/AmiB activator)